MYIKFAFNYPNLKTAKKVLDRASGGAMLMYIALIGAGLIGEKWYYGKNGCFDFKFCSRLFRQLFFVQILILWSDGV